MRTSRSRRALAVAMTAAASTVSCSADDPKIDITGVKACDVLDASQMATFGVDHISQDSTSAKSNTSSSGYSRCVWQSMSKYPNYYSIAVSLDSRRDNDWVGDKGKTTPISGSRASLLGHIMSVAAGPDRGVISIELLGARRPIREVTETVVNNLRAR